MTDLHLRRRLCMDDQVRASDVLGPGRTEDVVLDQSAVKARYESLDRTCVDSLPG